MNACVIAKSILIRTGESNFADKDLSLIVPDKPYISDVNARQVTFNWSPAPIDCPVYYTILSSNCGSCPTTTTNTTVACTDVPSDGGVCTFAVQTVPCGLISGEWTDNITLYLIPNEYGMFICTIYTNDNV